MTVRKNWKGYVIFVIESQLTKVQIEKKTIQISTIKND